MEEAKAIPEKETVTLAATQVQDLRGSQREGAKVPEVRAATTQAADEAEATRSTQALYTVELARPQAHKGRGIAPGAAMVAVGTGVLLKPAAR